MDSATIAPAAALPHPRHVAVIDQPSGEFPRFRACLILSIPTVLIGLIGPAVVRGSSAEPVRVGNVRQLFVDEYLIDKKQNLALLMHSPIPREIVMQRDRPWEGGNEDFMTVFKDGDVYRMYYRAEPVSEDLLIQHPELLARHPWTFTALALSNDGIKWTKPNFGIVNYEGSRQNNLVWPADGSPPWTLQNPPGHDMFPFKDENPAANANQRYKALANLRGFELGALVSPDGIHWRRLQQEPVISYANPDPTIDPPSLAFWDRNRRQYVAYMRCWVNYRHRGFRYATSNDFVHWSKAEVIDTEGKDLEASEDLYTNMTTLYERAPNVYLMFARRFVTWRRFSPAQKEPGLAEIVLLTSRDGFHVDRTFMEPFLAPGPDLDNWHDRAITMARGILETGPTELSLYYDEHFHLASNRFRRATIRPDGFVSVHAPWAGGEFTTKPMAFEGSELRINYSTSVAGSLRVEIEDASGKPIPGFRLGDCHVIFGDEIDRPVGWRVGHKRLVTEDRKEVPFRDSELGAPLKGTVIRLRFVMKAADLYAFRFN